MRKIYAKNAKVLKPDSAAGLRVLTRVVDAGSFSQLAVGSG